MLWSTKTLQLVVERTRLPRGLLDTSVIVCLETIDLAHLPVEMAISAITLAELSAGPGSTSDPSERARRQDCLQRTEATFNPLPFDTAAARAYGRIFIAVAAVGRKPRGDRAVDLLIASVALAAGLPLYTRNGDDFIGLTSLMEVVVV